MKFTLATLSALAAATSAFNVSLTFYGENNEESYSLLIPTDTQPVTIDDPLTVYRITSPGGGFCTLTGSQGESVVIFAEDEKFLETPQAMIRGSCDNN
ncbi:uncharacterized protein BDV14DRAFT_198956 [Aspergillus stella-maris]|uniref:uncharacterized protein n=1 Tax=Aspergillus stella-maris TaxID=1810926 RepID=UPI003CCDC24D